jgi:hypothetical protein
METLRDQLANELTDGLAKQFGLLPRDWDARHGCGSR